MKIRYSALDLALSDGFDLLLAGTKVPVDIRRVKQMQDVLPVPVKLGAETPTYYMYRDVGKDADKKLYHGKSMRFDVTVVPAMMLGEEYNKTYGHYHPQAHARLSYPEIYEVIEGEAHYLLQERGAGANEAKRVFLVHAKAGQKVLIPPNFGHITINKAHETLVMANITEGSFKSDYAPYKQCRGGAYYSMKGKTIPNPAYAKAGKLVESDAWNFNSLVSEKLTQDLTSGEMYSLFVKSPELFKFLVEPKLIELK